MPGPIRFPRADLVGVLERETMVRQPGLVRASSGTASRRGDTGGSPTFKRDSFLLSLLSADGVQSRLCRAMSHRSLARESDLGAIPPHPVEHHADASGQGNGCALLAPELRQTLRPGLQPVRPRVVQHHRGGLIERRAQTCIADLREPVTLSACVTP